jgi:molybdate transport system substrate-binding protein
MFRSMRLGWIGAAISVLVLACGLAGRSEAQPTDGNGVTVFAAASLKNALDSASAAYEKSTGVKVRASYAASSALAKQIEQAAPADVFISADLEWMDYLSAKGLIKEGSRRQFFGNRLVLIAPATSKLALRIAPGFALADALGSGRLAIGEVKAVPAGKYAKAALESLGAWEAVKSKLAESENVRAALALVAREEAALGIVYQTDAAAEPNVRVVGTFPAGSHAPIVYPVAITAESRNSEAAERFVQFLAAPEGAAPFEKAGFTVLK